MQAIISFTLAMILVALNEDAKLGFESLTGFSEDNLEEQIMIGTSVASMYTLVLLVRFFGMMALLGSC